MPRTGEFFAWAVGCGLAIGVLFTVVLFLGVLGARDFMLQDYPPAIRERYGRPKSARGKRVAAIAGAVALVGVVGILAVALWRLPAIVPDPGPLVVFGFVWVILQVFNIYDLVVLDWLVVTVWRPPMVVLPGTEDMPEYRDMGFHVRGFLKGIAILTGLAIVVAGVHTLISAIAR
jgi:hypothetical protein